MLSFLKFPQCFWHRVELIYSSHSPLITIQCILMLQNKNLWRKTCNLWPSLRQMVWMIIPKRSRSVTRSIARANIYGASDLTQQHCAKKWIWEQQPRSNLSHGSAPLKIDLTIQGRGSLSWIQEDKENLINGTGSVKILLCDGKHMEFSTVPPKNWQGLPMSTASSALPLFLRILPAGSHGGAVLLLSPERWNQLRYWIPRQTPTNEPRLGCKKSIMQCVENS